MPTLQLQLFGHFQLLVNGTMMPIHQARLQSLLAYMFLHRNTSQARQQLAFVFWPDSTEAQARANLRKALYDLRHVFADLDHFVQVESHYLQWQASATVTLDVTDFEELLAQALQAREPAEVQACLEQAIALYKGDLLPACYDDWLLRERECLRQRYLSSLEELVYLLEDRRELHAAILHAQQLLQADPLHESTYRTLMRLHLQNGDRARALRVYHACTTVLQQELGVEAGAETQAAYQRLLKMEVVTAAQPMPAIPMPRGELSLVGRQHEWEALQDAWRNASHGQPHFVLVAGEAGIGKTRLAEELRQSVDQQGSIAVATRSYAAEGQLAYAPVADWLRTAGMRTQLARLERVWLSEVARLLPELLVERADLPPPQPLADSWQRQRFREALARAFVASEQPVLLLLDDLQWCDRETLEWLHYLLRFEQQARLLVVGTVRPEEVEADHPLLPLLMNLRQDGKLLELELQPLNAAETAALAVQTAGHELDAEQSASVYAETEGYPLFVVEMMRARESGIKSPLSAQGPVSALSPKVQAMIGTRLLQLTASTRELVGLAAVVGRAFTVETLAQAGASDEDALVQGLDELWQRRLIREQGVNAYDFSHDKIREAAYAGISPARLRLLHGRVAQALERINAADLDAVSAQIAFHYEHAGLLQQAIDFYQQATHVAQRVYAHADAVANLTRAMALMEQLPLVPDHLRQKEGLRQKLRLQFALGVSLMTLKGTSAPELRELYLQAHEMAVQVGDDLEQLVASAGLHVAELTSGNVQAAYEVSQHEIPLAERVGDPSRLVEARGRLGYVLLNQGEFRASRDYLQQIVAYAEYQWSHASHPTSVWHWGITSRTGLATVVWHLGYPDYALEVIDEALALAQKLAHPYTLARILYGGACIHCQRREELLAQAWAERSIVLCQQHGFRYSLAQSMVIEGWALAQQGQIKVGIARMEEALASRLAMNAKIGQPVFHALLAETYGNTGQPKQGLRLLDETLAQVEASGERSYLAELCRLRGELLHIHGSSAEVIEGSFLQSLAIARQQEAKSLELRAALSLGRLWQLEKRQQAHDLLAEVYGWFSEGFETPDLIEAKALLESLA